MLYRNMQPPGLYSETLPSDHQAAVVTLALPPLRHALPLSLDLSGPRCACEAVSQSVSLREAELRIVLQGIGIDLPPPTPAPPTTHAAPIADLQLASTAELADSLKAVRAWSSWS